MADNDHIQKGDRVRVEFWPMKNDLCGLETELFKALDGVTITGEPSMLNVLDGIRNAVTAHLVPAPPLPPETARCGTHCGHRATYFDASGVCHYIPPVLKPDDDAEECGHRCTFPVPEADGVAVNSNPTNTPLESEVVYPGIIDQKTLSACLETAEQIIRDPKPERIERFQRTKAKLIAQVRAHPLSFDEWNTRASTAPTEEGDVLPDHALVANDIAYNSTDKEHAAVLIEISLKRVEEFYRAATTPSPAPDAIITGAKQNIEVAAQVAFESCKAALESGNYYTPLQVAASTAAAVRRLMENVPLVAPDKGAVAKRAAEKIEAEFAALFDEHGIGEVVPRIAAIIEAEMMKEGR